MRLSRGKSVMIYDEPFDKGGPLGPATLLVRVRRDPHSHRQLWAVQLQDGTTALHWIMPEDAMTDPSR